MFLDLFNGSFYFSSGYDWLTITLFRKKNSIQLFMWSGFSLHSALILESILHHPDNEYNSYYVRFTINKINITQNIKCMYFMLFPCRIYTMKGEIYTRRERESSNVKHYDSPPSCATMPISLTPQVSLSLCEIHHFSRLLYLSHNLCIHLTKVSNSSMFVLCAYIYILKRRRTEYLCTLMILALSIL